MKYIEQYKRAFIALFLLQISQITQALEFVDATMPVMLKYAYQARHTDPQRCIELSERYNLKQLPEQPANNQLSVIPSTHNSTLLLAYCRAQLSQYSLALGLLLPLLENAQNKEVEIRTLNLIASEIPKDERPQLSNILLLSVLSELQMNIEKKYFVNSPGSSLTLLLTLTNLSLQEDHYRDAHLYLEKIKDLLKGSKNEKGQAWLSYYLGIYYDQVGQPQLSSLHFQSANNIAEKNGLIKLSGLVKNSIIKMYQSKYRFTLAFDFANQSIKLHMATKNTVKQANSIIQFAILKRQNKEVNEALIYLFNALELIKGIRNQPALAYVYLELGRTYASLAQQTSNSSDIELAQKYLQNARIIFNQLNKESYAIESILLLAKLNIINNDPALAILQLEKTLQFSSVEHPLLRVQAYEMLALSYELINEPQQAIQHFKNFHALQNNIKERLFKLQQLQISEQLQLLEQTLEQDKLETQNQGLKSKAEIYKTSAYLSMIMFMITCGVLIYKLSRNKKLRKSERIARHEINFHSRTKLPTQQSHLQQFSTIYRNKPQFYALVHIPFLSELNELVGDLLACKVEQKLGRQLNEYFAKDAYIFHLRDNQILFISEQQQYKNAPYFVKKIEQFFDRFSKENQLPQNISTGVVAFPFLENVSRAITPMRTINLNNLALFAANQIRLETNKNSWVELSAINNLPPAFFDGDLWKLGQTAINKGLVKINSSDNDFAFNWPILNDSSLTEQQD